MTKKRKTGRNIYRERDKEIERYRKKRERENEEGDLSKLFIFSQFCTPQHLMDVSRNVTNEMENGN